MRKIYKSILGFAAGAALVAGVSTPSLSSAWGDNTGGRRSYTINQINAGILGDKITFNSISNSVIGDEKNFVGARLATNANAWNANEITVEDGKEYVIRLYAHNNSPLGRDAVSYNTRVAFNIPTESSTKVSVNGYIFSDNATPSEYWDYVDFVSDKAFHLDYVYGSALLENNGIGANGGVKLSDEIVTKAASKNGVQIGFDQLNGEVPGCYHYDNYVTIHVRAVYDNEFTITQKIRKAGTSGWNNGSNIEANVGDLVEIQAQYTNTNPNGQVQENVMVKTILPNNLRYVPGSTKLYNDKYNGAVVNQDTIVTTGINIGHYGVGANAYVRFTAEVVDNSLACGSNTLVDWTQAGVSQKTLQDYATVVVNKPCMKSEAAEYTVQINYIYAETGEQAAEAFVENFQTGDPFSVKSPVINGYTADYPVVTGEVKNENIKLTVTYTKNSTPVPTAPKEDAPVEPEEVPEEPKIVLVNTEPEVVNLPHTGAGEIASGVMATGATTTALGYYIASRKALRR